VLGALIDHRSLDTTRQRPLVGDSRRRDAVDKVTALQFDRHGNRIWRDAKTLLDSEHARRAIGEVAVPFGTCSELSNVQAGGNACPYRFRCAGCDHFRTDISYLPDLHAYLDDLLRLHGNASYALPPSTGHSFAGTVTCSNRSMRSKPSRPPPPAPDPPSAARPCRLTCSTPSSAPPASPLASSNSSAAYPACSANTPGANPGSAPPPTSTGSTSRSAPSSSRQPTCASNWPNATRTWAPLWARSGAVGVAVRRRCECTTPRPMAYPPSVYVDVESPYVPRRQLRPLSQWRPELRIVHRRTGQLFCH
jgi:hypothetical protein